jgi:ubiquinone/menaquinone biosynthesis C-methylase UbiE
VNTDDMEALRKKVDERNSIIYNTRYHKGLISTVLKAIPPQSKKILDIGCGYGNMTKFLEEKGDLIVGIDLGGVFYLPYVSEKLSFLKSDALHIPFHDETFDCLISLDVIEHLQDDQGFVNEIKRVLKPNGLAIVETPNRRRLSAEIIGFFKRNSRKFPKSYGHDPLLGDILHIREYTKPELKKLFEISNFSEVNVSGHWLGITSPEIGMQKPWKMFESLSQSWIVQAVK